MSEPKESGHVRLVGAVAGVGSGGYHSEYLISLISASLNAIYRSHEGRLIDPHVVGTVVAKFFAQVAVGHGYAC